MCNPRRLQLLVLAGGLALAVGAHGQSPAGARDQVVVRIGNRTVTVGDVERAMATAPVYQLRMLGTSREQIRARFLDQVVLGELWDLAARAEGLDRRSDVESRLREARARALLDRLRAESERQDVSDAEVATYYEQHRSEYRGEKRIQIWQIVVDSREKADRILQIIRTDPAYEADPVKRWSELAAEHSLDKTTAEHKGNLGVVSPDGSTAQKGVVVDPALYRAAERVERGQVVPEPVQVGNDWVVVQHRDSHTTQERTLKMVASDIRGVLKRKRYEQQLETLLEGLRKQHVGRFDPRLVNVVRVDSSTQQIVPAQRPGTLPRRRHPAAGPLQPAGRPGRMR